MANDIYFLFKSEDLKMLIDKGAVTIKTSSRLERGVINDKQVAIMVVNAEGYDEFSKPIGSVPGCPCPPCTAKSASKF